MSKHLQTTTRSLPQTRGQSRSPPAIASGAPKSKASGGLARVLDPASGHRNAHPAVITTLNEALHL